MIFGIDLGTTNSLIGTGEDMLTGLVPSNVDMMTRMQVGRDDVHDTVVSSYKTDMVMGSEGIVAVEASSIILRHLADVASRRYGENVEDVVISVPAYFSTSQREAVYKAAGKANLNVKCLINEPTAAALYVCRDLKDLVVVYDLGGGTFDVSIVDSRIGVYVVIATDGRVLGGDDLDDALVDLAVSECKVPVRYRNNANMRKITVLMRNAKEVIQKTHQEVQIDLGEYGARKVFTLTPSIYADVVKRVFSETITLTKYLIMNNVPSSEKPKIVFVGGSTNCPYLREMVLKEVGLEEIKSDISPDFLVARGVALYADMLYRGVVDECVEDVTKRLCIESKEGWCDLTVIASNTIVPCKDSIIVSNAKKSNSLSIRLYQGDSVNSEKNAYIGTLIYDYGRVVEAWKPTN